MSPIKLISCAFAIIMLLISDSAIGTENFRKEKGDHMKIVMSDWEFFQYEEFKEKVNLSPLDSSVFGYRDQFPDAIYAYHKGDITVEGNLEIDIIFDELNRIASEKLGYPVHSHAYGVWVAGNLRVTNAVFTSDATDMSRSLVVQGDLDAKSVIVGGICIQVLGNLNTDVMFQLGNAENVLIYREPFSGRMYRSHWKYLIRDHKGGLIEINRNNCKILTELLVPDILAPKDEFNLDEDDYYDLTYLIIEDDLVPALKKGKPIFLLSP